MYNNSQRLFFVVFLKTICCLLYKFFIWLSQNSCKNQWLPCSARSIKQYNIITVHSAFSSKWTGYYFFSQYCRSMFFVREPVPRNTTSSNSKIDFLFFLYIYITLSIYQRESRYKHESDQLGWYSYYKSSIQIIFSEF